MYELMVVGRTDSADSLFSKVEQMIKDANASSVSVEKMGKKQLAYPIKKQTEGEYFLFHFEAEGAAANSIADVLRLEQETVLRYMLLKADVKVAKTKGLKADVAAVKEEEPKEEKKAVKTVKVAASTGAKKSDTKVAAGKTTKAKGKK